MNDPRLVLASASRRRRELLAELGLHPEVRPPNVDETPHADESPDAYVTRLAFEKAGADVQADEVSLFEAAYAARLPGHWLAPVNATAAAMSTRTMSQRAARPRPERPEWAGWSAWLVTGSAPTRRAGQRPLDRPDQLPNAG